MKRITDEEILEAKKGDNPLYVGEHHLYAWDTRIADAQLASCEKECKAEVQKAREEERKALGEFLKKYLPPMIFEVLKSGGKVNDKSR